MQCTHNARMEWVSGGWVWVDGGGPTHGGVWMGGWVRERVCSHSQSTFGKSKQPTNAQVDCHPSGYLQGWPELYERFDRTNTTMSLQIVGVV